MPSKSKKQAKTMTAACKNKKFRKKVGISKKVACDFHKADKGKYHESVQLDEAKYLDLEEYGGWISPQKEVFYVQPYSHNRWMEEYYNMNQVQAVGAGWIRFITQKTAISSVLGLQGTPAGLKNTLYIWAPTAKMVDSVSFELFKNFKYGGTAKTADKDFVVPRETAKMVKWVKDLQESKLILETTMDTSYYGAWITPEKKVIYVDRLGDHEYKLFDHGVESYDEAWNKGWVRLVFEKSKHIDYESLNIMGKKNAIKSSYYVWLATAKRVDKVRIDLITDYNLPERERKHVFELPGDSKKLKEFLNASTDMPDNYNPERPFESLTEAKLEQMGYGAWITPDKEVKYVKDRFGHDTVIISEEGYDDYISAFEAGWIRVAFGSTFFGHNDLILEGKLNHLKKTYKMWAPVAIKMGGVSIDIVKSHRFDFVSKVYEFPKDREKMRNFFIGNEVLESILHEAKIDIMQYGGWITDKGQILYADGPEGHGKILMQQGIIPKMDPDEAEWMYGDAYEQGWVHFRVRGREFSITGRASSIKKHLKIWFPAWVEAEKDLFINKMPGSWDIFGPAETLRARNFANTVESVNEAKIEKTEGSYGGWITNKNEILYVDDKMGHHKVASRAFPENHGFNSYGKAYNAGWVRFVTEGGLGIQGTKDAIKRTKGLWFKAARDADQLFVDIIEVFKRDGNKDYHDQFGFKIISTNMITLPDQMKKLNKLLENEDVLGKMQPKSDIFSKDNLSDVLGNRYKVSLYQHNVSTMNEDWTEDINEIKSMDGLDLNKTLTAQAKFEAIAQELEALDENGWCDYFVVVERSKSMKENFKPSRFMQINRNLVELQTMWEDDTIRMDIFVDGRGVGHLNRTKEGKYVIGEASFGSVEEAIAALMTNAGYGTLNAQDQKIEYLRNILPKV